MIRELVHDPMFLAQKSETATKEDLPIATDLIDTLNAHLDECVGMAANMIGFKKNIIIVSAGIGHLIMINPQIISKKKPYNTEEGCLSLLGGPRKCKHFDEIEVSYLDMNWKPHKQKYNGWIAQIIQHEVDHLHGVLI